MSYLLDTHVLLWWLFDDDQLSSTARGVLQDPRNTIFVSSASAWEVATMHRIGRLASAAVFVQDIAGYVARAAFTALPITIRHGERAGSFPQSHRDPFDRMLAAQALLEDLALLTRDPQLSQFEVTVVW